MSVERGSKLGAYELRERIALGGQAEVWSAVHLNSGQQVAIKIVATTATSARRFLREIQLLADVSHPNVVQIHDVGTLPDGRAWYAMRRYARTLRDYLDLHGELSEYEAAALLAQIADALGTVHRHHIVHRDLTPSNILLSENGHAFLADFGVAAHDGAEPITAVGTIVGSRGFVAPESLRGERGTASSDAYSFGVIAYSSVMGHLPGVDARAAMTSARVDADFASVVGQLLDPDPTSRLNDLSLAATELKRIGMGLDRAERPRQAMREIAGPPLRPGHKRAGVLLTSAAFAACLIVGAVVVLAGHPAKSDGSTLSERTGSTDIVGPTTLAAPAITARDASATVAAYTDALQEGRVGDAWAMLSPRYKQVHDQTYAVFSNWVHSLASIQFRFDAIVSATATSAQCNVQLIYAYKAGPTGSAPNLMTLIRTPRGALLIDDNTQRPS